MIEMTVILRVAVDTSSGTAYLKSLARREQIARDIKARLGAAVRESTERAKGGVVTLSHLVDRAAVATYRERLEGLDVQVLGPGAPYSFGPPE